MATVCGGTLALMNAGVPIKSPVAGIAMGLVKEGDEFAVLTDIAGYEDHFGDMDFKVAGTEKGITAIQMDIKINGLTDEIIHRTIADARTAYLFILAKMKAVIAAPSEKLSAYAPVILTMYIPVDKIRDLIGPGGKNIKELVATFNVKINAEDDGKVSVAAANREVGERVIARIEAMTSSPEVNKIYSGKINRIEDYGLFVEIMPGVTGLLHVSEISQRRIRDVHQEFKLGQMIDVKLLALDRDNKMKLSHKALETNSNPAELQSPPQGGDKSLR
jgi:polyribonucleotide nucleotidyltransferase